jgi:hypothetical protein
MQKVLKQLRKASLQVDIKKSKFRVTCIKFLSFIVFIDNIKDIKVNLENIIVVKN